MPSPTPDPALVDRFRADCERLTGHALTPDERIGVAVSGGPDSMALLLLAHAAYGARVLAATVDHGLRPESVEEAAMVRRQCEAMGVAHTTLRPDQPLDGHADLQARARAMRYRLLGQWAVERGIGWIATAHHVDDQAETLLMRVARGSGLAGLAGIRAVNRDLGPVPILRPLLSWRRATLRGMVEACGARFALDPSNADAAYDRTRARALLRENDWLDPERLARTAANIAEDDALIARLADDAWNDRAEAGDRAVAWRAEGLSRPILRRMIARSIAAAAANPPRLAGPAIERLLAVLEAGKTSTLAGVQCTANGAIWTFRPAPPRRSG